MPDVYRHGREDERPVSFIGDVFTVKAQSGDTGGAYSVTDMTVSPRGAGPPVHHHPDCEEAFYVVSGALTFVVDGKEIPASAGTFLVVPRGAEHGYSNPSDEPAQVLVLISPPGFEQYFLEAGEPIQDG